VGNVNKPSLSWVGVPLKSGVVSGVIALASYKANAFNRSDVELLSALSQHVALTLDNIQLNETLREQARRDSMTGVYNHGYFVQELQKEAELPRKGGKYLGLIMLDLDHFKVYNDMFGHPVGDRVLVEASHVIRRHIKRTDTLGRWGGEEFAILLPDVTIPEALKVAERIRNNMERLILVLSPQRNERIPAPTVSQGVALYPLETDDLTRLVALADQRLYAAKERGRNQIEGP
jgi:diguanylate cyclase (GGDEF)-like protein